jgi:hypothetical protein
MEAECVALSETAKEIMFVKQVLETMESIVSLPILVKVDNVGAILSKQQVCFRTKNKHIDIRCHFVR